MDWSDVGKKLEQIGLPLLGAALPIPGGAAIGTALAAYLTGSQDTSPEATVALLSDPVQVEKAKEFWASNQTAIFQTQLAAATAQIQAVNATIQIEARTDHFIVYACHPITAYSFLLLLFCVYVVLPLQHVAIPAIPESVFMSIGGMLGIGSFFRGKAGVDPANSAVNTL